MQEKLYENLRLCEDGFYNEHIYQDIGEPSKEVGKKHEKRWEFWLELHIGLIPSFYVDH